MALVLVVTNAGRAALVAAANDGTNAVRIDRVGVSATATVASKTTAALPDEIKRIATLSGGVVADDTIHVVVRDESATAYTVRSIALYLADGTLFASYGQADPIVTKTAASLMLIALDVKFEDIAATSITFGDANFLNPPATEAVMGVAEIATVAEAKAGVDAQRIVTPAAARAAVRDWIGFDPVNRAGDDLTGDLRSNVSPRPFVMRIGANASAGISWQLGGKAGYDLVVDASGNFFANRSNIASGSYVDTPLALPNYGGVAVTGPLSRNGQTVWDAGNDGAGSGMDADMLDGLQAADFVRKAGDELTGDLRSNVSARPFVVRIGANASAGISWQLGGKAGYDIAGDASGNLYFNRSNIATGQFVGTALALGNDGGAAFGGPVSVGGNTVWHVGNDGASSGLDADLLDGKQATAFAERGFDAAFRDVSITRGDGTGALFIGRSDRYLFASEYSYELPGAPLNVQGQRAWTAGNDGAGSGLDADTLDGLQGADYARSAGQIFGGAIAATYVVAYGTGSGAKGTATMRGGDANNSGYVEYADANGTRRAFDGFVGATGAVNHVNDLGGGHRFGGGQLQRDGYTVWDAGNDGAGSGSDADLLDGHHALDFLLRSELETSITGNGFVKLPGGLIFQWGNAGTPSSAKVSVNFPIAFPNACFSVQATNGLGSDNPPTSWPGVRIIDRTKFDVISASAAGSAVNGFGVLWFAIGN